MTQAGRSTISIINAANFMLEWVNRSQLAGTEQPFRLQKFSLCLPATRSLTQSQKGVDWSFTRRRMFFKRWS